MTFDQVQHHITTFLFSCQRTRSDESSYKMKLSDAIFCAEDIIRNRAFRQAIQLAIQDIKKGKPPVIAREFTPIRRWFSRPRQSIISRISKLLALPPFFPSGEIGGIIYVLDAGSGTGILGLFALIHGATHCTFIEHNPHTLEINQKLIEEFGYTKQSTFIVGDACNIPRQDIKISKSQNLKIYTILLSETITSDLQTEDFIPIVAHLKQFLTPNAIIIPQKFDIQADHQTVTIESKNIDQETIKKLQGQKNYQGKVTLYKDVTLSSGDTPSFFNQRNL